MSKPINIIGHEGQAKISPGEYLGPEWGAYLEATRCAGATYDAGLKAQMCPLELVPKVIESLKIAGFSPVLQTELADAIKAKAKAARQEVEAAKDRLAATDAELAKRGLSLFAFQRTGVAWLAGRERALLADEMGCIDGDALVPFNRAGKSFKIRLEDAYLRFHGLDRKNWNWNPDIPTQARSLCGDELRLNRVTNIIDKGMRPCVEIALRSPAAVSGKRLVATPDHEVAMVSGWIAAGKLAAGDRILTNGRHYNDGARTIFWSVEDEVLWIKDVGVRHVFDMVMADPYRNFVADGIIVHNCGKTIQTLVALPSRAPTILVCPASLKGNWAKETAKWRPDLKTTILSGRGAWKWPEPGEVVISNYDILPDLEKPVQALDPLFAKGLVCNPGTVLVADEAHNLKTKRSLRRTRWNLLRKEILAKGGKVWLLTGTPLLNDPRELWSILECADLVGEAFGSWPRFLRLFDAVPGAYGITSWGKPAAEVPELLRRVMLLRRRKEVLPDLPTKIWRTVDVELDMVTKTFCDQVMAEMQAQGLEPDDIWDRIEEGRAGVAFERISAVRNALAIAKIPALLELVDTYEDNNEPIVVFSAHRPPIDKLGQREGWATITGDTPNEKRQEIVDAFQGGRLKGIGLTIQAGGVGLTLTKAHQAIFVDLMWTPALNKQAEDRICRIGQTRGVIITTLVGNHDLDYRVAEKLREKQALIESSVEAARVVNPDIRTVADELEAIEGVKTSDAPVLVANSNFRPAKCELEQKAADKILVLAQANGRGFTIRDYGFGHSLATSLRKYNRLSEKQWTWAVKLAEKYGDTFIPPREAKSDLEAWAAKGLLIVAGLDPDYAAARNDMGFSRYDGEKGHDLANNLRQNGRLTDEQWRAVVHLAHKYRRQVGEPPKTPEVT